MLLYPSELTPLSLCLAHAFAAVIQMLRQCGEPITLAAFLLATTNLYLPRTFAFSTASKIFLFFLSRRCGFWRGKK
ncbi:uncharacterized protein EV420DRAFT_1592883 [Desarmillaria tabescens]|uniref:Uncharacterized protein n=1 Tax=Armillaria tabescens TaxID=1929756 RepID=A0AA39J4R3_ARMTA|nr:uncharacterized protein EV420DRAFT_1754291 [Desarmillaria tabescens]XP_060322024.1 uncharacterized protein EV420DRAFT_1592883 [Desarmillaria tabescens]KAK0434862.1 hypothetical protein EV420DRAFT_1754291 [Desarmillaria tabescens]KAK0435584.1 hypothetical protein EV420DRAFT_1592883 [Desarmillaria tabescens]